MMDTSYMKEQRPYIEQATGMVSFGGTQYFGNIVNDNLILRKDFTREVNTINFKSSRRSSTVFDDVIAWKIISRR